MTLPPRFLSKMSVPTSTGCLLWTASKNAGVSARPRPVGDPVSGRDNTMRLSRVLALMSTIF